MTNYFENSIFIMLTQMNNARQFQIELKKKQFDMNIHHLIATSLACSALSGVYGR